MEVKLRRGGGVLRWSDVGLEGQARDPLPAASQCLHTTSTHKHSCLADFGRQQNIKIPQYYILMWTLAWLTTHLCVCVCVCVCVDGVGEQVC